MVFVAGRMWLVAQPGGLCPAANFFLVSLNAVAVVIRVACPRHTSPVTRHCPEIRRGTCLFLSSEVLKLNVTQTRYKVCRFAASCPVPSLPALWPLAPPAERGPSLESIYRVSLTVDLCEG